MKKSLNYARAQELMQTCRNRNAGKPIASGLRLFESNGVFTVRRYDTPIARLHSGNKLELLGSPRDLTTIGHHLGITCYRIAKNKYRVHGHKGRKEKLYPGTKYYNPYMGTDWGWHKANDPQYYDGIAFDLSTGVCLNKLPDEVRVVNNEAQAEWRRKLTAYRKQWGLRVKLGIVKDRALTLAERARADNRVPAGVRSADDLRKIIETQDFETGIDKILYSEYGWRITGMGIFNAIEQTDFMKAFQSTYNGFRDTIRSQLGCFRVERSDCKLDLETVS